MIEDFEVIKVDNDEFNWKRYIYKVKLDSDAFYSFYTISPDRTHKEKME